MQYEIETTQKLLNVITNVGEKNILCFELLWFRLLHFNTPPSFPKSMPVTVQCVVVRAAKTIRHDRWCHNGRWNLDSVPMIHAQKKSSVSFPDLLQSQTQSESYSLNHSDLHPNYFTIWIWILWSSLQTGFQWRVDKLIIPKACVVQRRTREGSNLRVTIPKENFKMSLVQIFCGINKNPLCSGSIACSKMLTFYPII